MTQPKTPPVTTKGRYASGVAALLMAVVLNHFGDRLLNVNIEVFTGLSYFSPQWVLDVFFVPLLAGIVVSMIYGMGGKWLCYFPPIIVRAINYYHMYATGDYPAGGALMPLGWWGFFVILVVEAAVIGGVIGEVILKKTYGRRPRHLIFNSKSPPLQDPGA